jgi:uncharacterized membrane protein
MSDQRLLPRISDSRIRNLGDGVFSIAMTLLVLGLKTSGDGPLLDQVLHTLPRIGIYFLAFIQLGLVWIAHTYELEFEKDANRWYSWCNLLLFMFVALLPFSVGVLGDHPLNPISSLVYGVNMVAIQTTLLLYWGLGWNRLDSRRNPKHLRVPLIRTGGALLIFVCAILIGFYDPRISFALYVIVPMIHVMPSRAEKHAMNADH